MRVEINEIEMDKQIRFFMVINKIYKLVARLIKKKGEKAQNTRLRN